MLTLQTAPQTEAKYRPTPEFSIEAALRSLSSSMTRGAAETAGAFFCTQTSPGIERRKTPRLTDLGSLHCSQKNLGDKFEMTCNLAVERGEWEKMFADNESEQFKMDAFCEMANCICGTLIADPSFTDEFGYMIPCVPCSGPCRILESAPTLRGAFRLAGIRVYFAFTVQETAAVASRAMPLTVAA